MNITEGLLQKIENKEYVGDIYDSLEFGEKFNYNGELGVSYSEEETVFKVWSPVADKLYLNLYKNGEASDGFKKIFMHEQDGLWSICVRENLKDIFYDYTIQINGENYNAVDPYAKAVGVNGNRGAVIDFKETDPEGFRDTKKPKLVNVTDSIIYELHVRDFSISDESGIQNKGKFLAFTEDGTKNKFGDKTGIDHLKELGITHVHLLPVFDFDSIDESNTKNNEYNWGYDPKNYNALEGSYSTNPYDPKNRIIEFKKAIKALHEKGIRVVMDVVYNHTAKNEESNFHKLVPFFYHRQNKDGSFSNASACGNETASDRFMVNKFIIDSVKFFASEYMIDGFRFDLMEIHDIKTMNDIRRELDKIDKTIIMYGEGWNGGHSTLDSNIRASKANVPKLDTMIAAFSDDIRDGIKGHVFYENVGGFATGDAGLEETIKFGVVASTYHGEVDYEKVNYSKKPWALEPTQTITYISAHDNLTLWDKIEKVTKSNDLEYKKAINKLSCAIVYTSQGIPFMQAGEEFLRTKNGEHNSFKSDDSINKLDYNRKHIYKDVFEYYKGAIKLRKKYYSFRMNSSKEIRERIKFLEQGEKNLVSYIIKGHAQNTKEDILVIYNANNEDKEVKIPNGKWGVLLNKEIANDNILSIITGNNVKVQSVSAMVLVRI